MLDTIRTFLTTRAAIALIPTVLVLGACDDDVIEPDNEPTFSTVVFTVGTQTVTMAEATGAVTGGPITLQAGQNANMTATFRLANGSADPVVTASDFRLDVASDNSAIVSFTRTGPFAGTLVAGQKGTTNLRIELFHIGEGHEEFGPFPLTVVVN